MDVTSPAQIKALPHTLTFGVGLLLGIGLILSSNDEAPFVVLLVVFFVLFFLYGDLRGGDSE